MRATQQAGPTRAKITVAPDSALAELRDDDVSRKRFLRMIGGGSAVAGLGFLLAACGDDDNADTGAATTPSTGASTGSSGDSAGDLEILNYALTLEYLEADFYAKAAESGMLKGPALEFGKQFGAQEQEHVDALKAAVEQMGGTPAEIPKAKFPLESQDAILELAATVENLGASAYLGQAGKIKSKEILASALAIHTVEARHAAALNVLTGKKVTPDGAFAVPADMDAVLAAVKPFLVS